MTDWTNAEILQLIGIFGQVVIAALAVWAVKIGKDNHSLVNSRMGELLELTRKSAQAKGLKEGRAEKR